MFLESHQDANPQLLERHALLKQRQAKKEATAVKSLNQANPPQNTSISCSTNNLACNRNQNSEKFDIKILTHFLHLPDFSLIRFWQNRTLYIQAAAATTLILKENQLQTVPKFRNSWPGTHFSDTFLTFYTIMINKTDVIFYTRRRKEYFKQNQY